MQILHKAEEMDALRDRPKPMAQFKTHCPTEWCWQHSPSWDWSVCQRRMQLRQLGWQRWRDGSRPSSSRSASWCTVWRSSSLLHFQWFQSPSMWPLCWSFRIPQRHSTPSTAALYLQITATVNTTSGHDFWFFELLFITVPSQGYNLTVCLRWLEDVGVSAEKVAVVKCDIAVLFSNGEHCAIESCVVRGADFVQARQATVFVILIDTGGVYCEKSRETSQRR